MAFFSSPYPMTSIHKSLQTPTACAEPPFSDPNVPGPIRPRAGHVFDIGRFIGLPFVGCDA